MVGPNQFRRITLDNYNVQKKEKLQDKFQEYKIQCVFAPNEYTDCIVVINYQLGRHIKNDMHRQLEDVFIDDPELFETYMLNKISIKNLRI